MVKARLTGLFRAQRCAADPGPTSSPGSSMGPRSAEQCERALHRVGDTQRLLRINVLRIEQPLPIHERQPCPALARFDLAVKTRLAAGVAGSAGLLDADPDRVLVAIHPHLDHPLDVTGGFALSP